MRTVSEAAKAESDETEVTGGLGEENFSGESESGSQTRKAYRKLS